MKDARIPTALQDASGLFLRHACPSLRAELLEHWTSGGTELTRRRRWLFEGLARALDREYYASTTPTSGREAVKRLCMGRASGVSWAEAYLKRGFPDAFTPMLKAFAWIEEELAAGRVGHFHQVACCSAREIAYYARRYPKVQFTGSDVDPAIVEFLRHHWRELPNLRFEVVALDEAAGPSARHLESDLLFASGGLHYLDEASLVAFLARAREVCSTLILSQPLDAGFDPALSPGSQPRQMLSWNHAYLRGLEASGWRAIEANEALAPGQAAVKNLAARARSQTSS